jgi:hypothetical protein
MMSALSAGSAAFAIGARFPRCRSGPYRRYAARYS